MSVYVTHTLIVINVYLYMLYSITLIALVKFVDIHTFGRTLRTKATTLSVHFLKSDHLLDLSIYRTVE